MFLLHFNRCYRDFLMKVPKAKSHFAPRSVLSRINAEHQEKPNLCARQRCKRAHSAFASTEKSSLCCQSHNGDFTDWSCKNCFIHRLCLNVRSPQVPLLFSFFSSDLTFNFSSPLETRSCSKCAQPCRQLRGTCLAQRNPRQKNTPKRFRAPVSVPGHHSVNLKRPLAAL